MPLGILVNVASVVLGALLGTQFSGQLSQRLNNQMTAIFGLCAVGMGIASVGGMQHLPAVVLAVIVGTLVGLVLCLGNSIQKLSQKMLKSVQISLDADRQELLLTAVVLFCFSSSGMYGALDAGMTGSHSVLLAKSVLDFFTDMIFECSLGPVMMLIGIPQATILLLLYALAQIVVPLTTPAMIADFKACGGFLLIATGLRMMHLKAFPVADMIPAMLLVMPISYLWSTLR